MTDYLTAESGVRRLHARYADAVFRKDYESFADCFAEDAEWHVGGSSMRGRAEAVAFLKSKMELFHWVIMTFRTPILEVGDGVASGRTYVTENNAFKDGRPGNSVATYYERFVLQEHGIWRRRYAFFQLHFMGSADAVGTFFEQPNFGPPPAMPPADAKTVVGIKPRSGA